MAGLQVPTKNLDLARGFLDSRSSGKHKGIYNYKDFGANSIPRKSMVVVGMYSQQLFGIKPDDKRQIESARHLATRMPATAQKDYYYWHYG
jgi:hypothetical protein